VAYLHQWNDSRDGGFIYWNTDDLVGKTVPPLPLAGSSVDGSKVVHAAMVYQPKGFFFVCVFRLFCLYYHVAIDRVTMFVFVRVVCRFVLMP